MLKHCINACRAVDGASFREGGTFKQIDEVVSVYGAAVFVLNLHCVFLPKALIHLPRVAESGASYSCDENTSFIAGGVKI